MREIIVIAHNIRSAHNIGSIMRTCEGLGIKKLILSGYSPYPKIPGDKRLPHVASNAARKINKTALGAEEHLQWEHSEDIFQTISGLRAGGYLIASLEQSPDSIKLSSFKPPQKIAVILGSEIEGVDQKIIDESDLSLEIEMTGKKESFNVSIAAAMCLYKLSALR